jgi:hypothetical protein
MALASARKRAYFSGDSCFGEDLTILLKDFVDNDQIKIALLSYNVSLAEKLESAQNCAGMPIKPALD